MIHAVIPSIFFVTAALMSAIFYDHRGRKYADGKNQKIKSPWLFGAVYRYVQISTLGIALVSMFSDAPALLEIHESLALRYAGVALAAIGLAIFIGAKLHLGEHYSPCFDSYVPRDFIRDGIYKYVRHPIYTANIILLAGFFLASGSLWLLANVVVVFVFYRQAAVVEETALAQAFQGYRDYIQSSGRFFPPLRLAKQILKPAHR